FEKDFKRLESELSLLTKVSNSALNSNKELKTLVYKAVYIRYVLFSILNINEKSIDVEIDLSKDSNSEQSFDLLLKMNDLSQAINVLKYDLGHKFYYNN